MLETETKRPGPPAPRGPVGFTQAFLGTFLGGGPRASCATSSGVLCRALSTEKALTASSDILQGYHES
eukprot:8517765-Pyramimonas_sp.AAC.1